MKTKADFEYLELPSAQTQIPRSHCKDIITKSNDNILTGQNSREFCILAVTILG